MKKYFLNVGVAFLLGSSTLFSQQDPQFTQFAHNKLFINPGYAGMSHALCFTGIARQQWSGFDGAPKSGNFSADFFVRQLSGGVGINILYDQLGFENNLGCRFNYSFHRNFRNGGTLGIGLEGGLLSKRVGPTGSNSWQSSTSWQNDPTIPRELKKTVMDMGAGIWYQQRNFWVGVSSTHLNGKEINGTDVYEGTTLHPLLYQMARHYFVAGGMTLLPGRPWEIHPSLLLKSDATITSLDMNVEAIYNQRFWVGASYRINDAICPMLGFNWTKMKPAEVEIAKDGSQKVIRPSRPGGTMKMGFAYDYTTSKLKNYNNGTFEIFLNYCIPMSSEPKPFEVNSERFFK